MSTAVKAAAANADELIRQMAAAKNDDAAPVVPTLVEAAPVVDDPAEGQEPSIDGESAYTPPIEAQDPGDGYQSDGDTGNPGVGDGNEELAKWEQRYKSLAGVVQSRDRQIEELRQLLSSLAEGQNNPQPQDASPVAPTKLDVSDAERTEFGEDLIDLIHRIAAANSDTGLESRIAKIEQSLSGVERTTAAAAQNTFEEQLDKLIPKWRSLNTDPLYIQWLQASQARLTGFGAAVQQGSAEDASMYFIRYAQEAGMPSLIEDVAQGEQLVGRKPPIAPGQTRSRSNPDPKKPKGVIWTRQLIKDLYANAKSMPKDEFVAKERDLFRAQKEGRVQQTLIRR